MNISITFHSSPNSAISINILRENGDILVILFRSNSCVE
ncbi:hypothetical protein VCRA2119O147_730020 [Vibrio crassostreae]|nr:hypothetical protein VCRA2114E123_280041 [Vibrio crassostreae]CAK1941604.1 hypothetical protein VCRA2118O236_280042 [Vibrio crassostreae]CAK1944044.1 hypothetical protein VCRA2110O113_280042 [Vibrio crassostreae]CAK1945819.1 hypothetical protein VCRA2114E122_280041 [Vibrio crassostreae]CAK1958871.1 hypothetical protein VCRA2112O184_270007 [Vibrio crassostreae]